MEDTYHRANRPLTAPCWVVKADIASCFDEISHQWLLENIPVDKKMLKQRLSAGFLDKGKLYPTLKGTPQGGTTSPILKYAERQIPLTRPGTTIFKVVNIRKGILIRTGALSRLFLKREVSSAQALFILYRFVEELG